MSTSGTYQLINNTGIQDQMILDIDGLNQAIENIRANRLARIQHIPKYSNMTVPQIKAMTKEWEPTIAEIERTHIVFCSSFFKPFVSMGIDYRKNGVEGGSMPKLGERMYFTLPSKYGSFINDCVVYVKLTGFAAIDPADKVRYIEYIGHRLFKDTRLKIFNSPIDNYGPEKYNIHWQYKVPVGKETGYLRCIGQEQPQTGLLTADPAVDEWREYRYFGDGAQTFKSTQPTLELWIPLLFWFKDLQTALPNFHIPHGQIQVEMDLESESNLVAYANYSGNPGTIYTAPVISDCALYSNHIYLNPTINDILALRTKFQLIRINRTQKVFNVTKASDSIRLHDLKFPIETMYVAFRPTANNTNSQKWHRNTVLTDTNVKQAVVTGVATIQVNEATYFKEAPVVSKLLLKTSDIVLYPEMLPTFYNSYMPYRYGPNLKTPKDLGWYMINFAMNPGEYQPSGHFNASQDREMFLFYESAVNNSNQPQIRAANPVDIYICAEVINFIFYEQNNAVLRFAT